MSRQIRIVAIKRVVPYDTIKGWGYDHEDEEGQKKYAWDFADAPEDTNDYLLAEVFTAHDGHLAISNDEISFHQFSTDGTYWKRQAIEILRAYQKPPLYKKDIHHKGMARFFQGGPEYDE